MGLAVTHRVADPATLKTPLLILLVAKGAMPAGLGALDAATGGALARCWATGDFTGAKDETALLYPAGSTVERVLLVGLGEADKVTPAIVRRAAMIGGKRARSVGAPGAAVVLAADAGARVAPERAEQSIAEGIPFGAWHYPDLKRPPENPKPAFERCELVTVAADTAF